MVREKIKAVRICSLSQTKKEAFILTKVDLIDKVPLISQYAPDPSPNDPFLQVSLMIFAG